MNFKDLLGAYRFSLNSMSSEYDYLTPGAENNYLKQSVANSAEATVDSPGSKSTLVERRGSLEYPRRGTYSHRGSRSQNSDTADQAPTSNISYMGENFTETVSSRGNEPTAEDLAFKSPSSHEQSMGPESLTGPVNKYLDQSNEEPIESPFLIDTELTHMENGFDSSTNLAIVPYGGIFTGDTIGEKPLKEIKDLFSVHNSGAWGAPDSWAVKRADLEHMADFKPLKDATMVAPLQWGSIGLDDSDRSEEISSLKDSTCASDQRSVESTQKSPKGLSSTEQPVPQLGVFETKFSMILLQITGIWCLSVFADFVSPVSLIPPGKTRIEWACVSCHPRLDTDRR